MSVMASQITSLTIVYSTVYSGTDERKYQSSASLAFVCGIHRWPFDGVIMQIDRQWVSASVSIELWIKSAICKVNPKRGPLQYDIFSFASAVTKT